MNITSNSLKIDLAKDIVLSISFMYKTLRQNTFCSKLIWKRCPHFQSSIWKMLVLQTRRFMEANEEDVSQQQSFFKIN